MAKIKKMAIGGMGGIGGMANSLFKSGMPPRGMPPRSMPTQVTSPQGMPPRGLPDDLRQYMPTQVTSPQGMPPRGMLDDLRQYIPTQVTPPQVTPPRGIPDDLRQYMPTRGTPPQGMPMLPQALHQRLKGVFTGGRFEDGGVVKKMTNRAGLKEEGYKKGGLVSSASSRGDGCAIKGKTKGRFV